MLPRMPQVARRAALPVLIVALLVGASTLNRSREACTLRRKPSGAAALGSASAPETVIYYTDFRCSACRAFANRELAEIRRRFVDPGKWRIVIKEASSTPPSVEDATAARCAGEFGKYWIFHDSLFAAGDSTVTSEVRRRIAAHVGVPDDPFARCVQSKRYAATIHAEKARADSLGVAHLPLLLLVRDDAKCRLNHSMRRPLLLEVFAANAVDVVVGSSSCFGPVVL
jgi:hypothetical protein